MRRLGSGLPRTLTGRASVTSQEPARQAPITVVSVVAAVRAISSTYQAAGMATTTIAEAPTRITVGIDTYGETNVAALLDERGRLLGTESFPTTASGHRRLERWAQRTP
jgi:hypothetical protein